MNKLKKGKAPIGVVITVLLILILAAASWGPATAAPPTPAASLPPQAAPHAPGKPQASPHANPADRPLVLPGQAAPMASPRAEGYVDVQRGVNEAPQAAEPVKGDDPRPMNSGDNWQCDQPYDIIVSGTGETQLCSITVPLMHTYVVDGTWDVNLDVGSSDIYGTFLGRLYVGGNARPQEMVISPNLGQKVSNGPWPRITSTRSWIITTGASGVLQLMGRKLGGNGTTRTMGTHTGLRVVQLY